MKIHFYWMGGASWVVKADGAYIGCDPTFAPAGTDYSPGKRLIEPKPLKDGTDKIRCWLLTHNHFDHIDEEGLAYISPSARVIAHPNLTPRLERRFKDLVYLNWDEMTSFQMGSLEVSVTAIPGIHGSSPKMIKAMGQVNGYLMELTSEGTSRSIYITADTVPDERIYGALKGKAIDILIANLGNAFASKSGGPITLSVDGFKELLTKLNPEIALPVHMTDFDWFEMSDSDLSSLENTLGVVKPEMGTWLELKGE